MLSILSIASIITVIETASTKEEGLGQARLLTLKNQRQRGLPKDLLETIVSFIDTRSDAQIWFEAFKDPNERMRLFNATTWDQLYHECQGSNKNIKQRLNPARFYFHTFFDESSDKIIGIEAYVDSYLRRFPEENEAIFKSLYLKDLKQLRSLKQVSIQSLSSGQTVPDFNGWSDELEFINLENNNFIGSVSFSGFPKKLSDINLSKNPGLNGYLTLPEDIPVKKVSIHFDKNPNLYITQDEAISIAAIEHLRTPHYDIHVQLWRYLTLVLTSHRKSADIMEEQ